MKHILQQRGFDVAGVKESANAPVTGYVAMRDLDGGLTSAHVKAFCPEHLVSEATPLAQVLGSLRRQEHVFIVVGAGVKGIITRADLNKPPVRLYLFALLSLLEMHLRFWVRTCYKGDSWQTKLKSNRLQAAKNLQEERRARNEHISLLDCVQFCDLRDLVADVVDVRAKLDLGSKNKSIDLLKRAEDLRNRLAHSQDDLVEGMAWEELIDVVERIENTVGLSDDAVEAQAQEMGNGKAVLWVAGSL